MKYTYRKRPLPGSPRVESTLLRDGRPVVTDIAANDDCVRAAVAAALRCFVRRPREAGDGPR
jgi:hypothetical protein